jgi:chromosome segregation ATPase
MAGASDPFYVAKDEVAGALASVKHDVSKWQSSGRKAEVAERLLHEVDQVEQDVKDLGAAIDIAARDPARYRCDAQELSQRRSFVSSTERALQDCRGELARAVEQERARVRAEQEAQESDKRARAEARNSRFIDSERATQEQAFAHQDNELHELTKCTERLNEKALVINNELEDQKLLLEQLDQDIDRQAEKMNFVMKHMAKVLKTSDTKQLYLIMVLTVIFVILCFIAFS